MSLDSGLLEAMRKYKSFKSLSNTYVRQKMKDKN